MGLHDTPLLIFTGLCLSVGAGWMMLITTEMLAQKPEHSIAIGAALHAGTNCGACRAGLATILDGTRTREAAE